MVIALCKPKFIVLSMCEIEVREPGARETKEFEYAVFGMYGLIDGVPLGRNGQSAVLTTDFGMAQLINRALFFLLFVVSGGFFFLYHMVRIAFERDPSTQEPPRKAQQRNPAAGQFGRRQPARSRRPRDSRTFQRP